MGSSSYPVFSNCTNLSSLTIGENVIDIPNYAFYGRSRLTSVTIPNSVIRIGSFAFFRCSRLTSVTIGSAVTSIGESAFENCNAIIEIHSKATDAPLLSNNSFANVPSYIPVHIPNGSLSAYEMRWSYFFNFIEDGGTEGIDDVAALNAKVYRGHGQIVVEGADGYRVTLYDVAGRVLATKQDDYSPLHFEVPCSGAYLIKIGNHPARRVVVVR